MTTASGRPDWTVVRDRLVFAGVLGVSAVVLFAPSPPGPALFPYADTAIHAALFAALGWSGRRAGAAEPVVAVALVAYAGASELVQAGVLPERSGSWLDFGADLVGGALGLLAARAHRRAR